MKTTPLALPGRCRMRTSPAIARRVDRQGGEIGGADEAALRQFGAQEGERVALYRQTRRQVIFDDMLAQWHFRQQRSRQLLLSLFRRMG